MRAEIPTERMNGDRVPDGENIKDRLPDDEVDAIARLLTLSKLVARQGRVINAEQNEGDLTVDIVVTHRNFLPGYTDREIARVRSVMVAIAGNPYITTVKEIPSEGVKRATEVQSREKLGNRKHLVGGRVLPELPENVKYGDYMYRIKVVGRELGPYTDKQ